VRADPAFDAVRRWLAAGVLLGAFGCTRAAPPNDKDAVETAEFATVDSTVAVRLSVVGRPPAVTPGGMVEPRERRAAVTRSLGDVEAYLVDQDGAAIQLVVSSDGVLTLPAPASGTLVVVASSVALPISVRACDGENCANAPVYAACAAFDGTSAELLVDDTSPVGGAFWLLGTVSRGYRAAFDAFAPGADARTAPPVVVAWERGETPSCATSCFDAMGRSGVLSILSTDDDTDEFDDLVVLHEVGHFVEWAWLGGGGAGGYHDGAPVPPELAFSEGFATWFALTVDGADVYVDGNRHGGAWADYASMPVLPPLSLDSATSEEWVIRLLREVIGTRAPDALGRLAALREELGGDAFWALSTSFGAHAPTVDSLTDGAWSRFAASEGVAPSSGTPSLSPITPLGLRVSWSRAAPPTITVEPRGNVSRYTFSQHAADGSMRGAPARGTGQETMAASQLPGAEFGRAEVEMVGGAIYSVSSVYTAAPVPSGGALREVSLPDGRRALCAQLTLMR
jgi:hypothetical protein